MKGAQWDTWDMEPLSCPKRRPIQLRILLYFFGQWDTWGRFLRPPVPSVPLSQCPLIYCFIYRLYEQEWDSVLDRVSQCPKLLASPWKNILLLS